jgi:hypothetical protein
MYVSDGGPIDQVRDLKVQEWVQTQIDNLLPLHYCPLLLPKPRGNDTVTHKVLNFSNPSLASNGWLCLELGTSWSLVVSLLNDSTPHFNKENCNYMKPFKVFPNGFNISMCFLSPYKNNSFDMDVGLAQFIAYSYYINISEPICLGKGTVFVCGDKMANPFLPLNWTGSCTLAMLLPDVEILPGSQQVPLPSFDPPPPWHKRAISFIPLLIGALVTGSAGIGVALDSYTKLSSSQ